MLATILRKHEIRINHQFFPRTYPQQSVTIVFDQPGLERPDMDRPGATTLK
jgi:hypothetical protein